MVVLAVLGALVAIAIPNFIATSNRAKEASLKANMHAFQFVAEDFLIKNETSYATDASQLASTLRSDFDNPFDLTKGPGRSWEDRASMVSGPTPLRGITSYADSLGSTYNIKGYGASKALDLVLTSGLPSQRNASARVGLDPVDDDLKRAKPTSLQTSP